jgi:glycosyltransferase involved in cell wall biosynthesis
VKIAVVTHFYPPEPCAAATRVASLVGALADAGHDVTVVTNFPSFPAGRFARGDRGALVRTESAGAVRVVRLCSLLMRNVRGARFVHWASAGASALVHLILTHRKYDVVIVSVPPITLAPAAVLGAAWHRARLVVDVRDVFPDIAIAMGAWRGDGALSRAAEWVVRRLYRRADLIVAVTPTALSQIARRGVDRSRLMLARNAAEDAAPAVGENGRARDGFTAIYAGNVGLATDVDLLVDTARLLADGGITIEIVGDGARMAHVSERVRNEGLRNVALRGSMPRADAARAVAHADVSIVPLRRGIEESVPTKLYDSLALGCPVVVAADGEARAEGAALGAVCTPPGDAQALATALRGLSVLDRDALRALGREGKRRLQGRADRSAIMAELAERISALR